MIGDIAKSLIVDKIIKIYVYRLATAQLPRGDQVPDHCWLPAPRGQLPQRGDHHEDDDSSNQPIPKNVGNYYVMKDMNIYYLHLIMDCH